MFTYTYNPDTKEYLGKIETELDPLETEQQGQQVWLLPADSTFTAPLEAKDGFAIVWNGEAWEYTEDHRGKEYWLPGDTWESQPREMKDLGPLPDGALLEKPEKLADLVFNDAKNDKMQEINAGFERTAQQLVATYPQSELLTFDQQTAEAEAYLADPTAECPMLAPLAAARGITMEDLCQRVMAKHAAFSAATGLLMGQRQAMEDRLELAETVEDVQAIEVVYSLPGAE